MSPLDALFLRVEDGVSHMHIGSCAVFDGPAPSFAEVCALIEGKLVLAPRYRQKVRFVPAGLGHPAWVDDPGFALGDHMIHTELPHPGDRSSLEALMGRVMSHELDRRRPLWEIWMVEGLADGRWALLCKVHHCMVDGISGTDLIATLLDIEREAAMQPPAPWHPAPEPSALRLVSDSLITIGQCPLRLALSAPWRTTRPVRNMLTEAASGVGLFWRLVTPTRPLSIEGRIGTERQWATSRCTLGDVRTIRQAFGGSCNDVVLGAVGGAFRRVLAQRGEVLEETSVLRTLVPVSTRRPGDGTPNNQVSLLIAELPIGMGDPVARLEAVSAQMSRLKASHQADAAATVIAGAELVPPILFSVAARAAMGVLRRHPQRSINTVTTNVPGPQFPLYALGREMVEYLPYVPIAPGVRLGVAIVSYNGWLSFGVTGDEHTAGDVRTMAEAIVDELAALRRLATRHRKKGSRS